MLPPIWPRFQAKTLSSLPVNPPFNTDNLLIDPLIAPDLAILLPIPPSDTTPTDQLEGHHIVLTEQ